MRGFGIACLAVLIACGGSRERTVEPSEAVIAAKAKELRAAAERVEPQTTAMLVELADEVGGQLAGLEHRLKKESSLIRKIKSRLTDGAGRTMETVDIVDALRYTMLIEDRPSGHYVSAAHRVLAALETRDVEVVRVKNYWPRGDNYSGVNVVLRNADQFQWEIQFHTPASAKVRDEWHDSYRILRDHAVDPERRRAIFDQMAPPWETVDIPAQALVEKNLHETETIILYPRP